jgi:hypothetical protein
MGFLHQLQKRWGVKSVFQVVMILLVFTCTGFSVLYVEEWILALLGVPKEIPDWLRVLLFIVITLPVYQILLLFYGFLFGQFRFFFAFEKRFFSRIFGGKKNNPS